MIIGPYNFNDEQQLNTFINEIKAEQSDDINRSNLLDELQTYIMELADYYENN